MQQSTGHLTFEWATSPGGHMEGWIVFLAGIGLMVSEIVTRLSPNVPPAQKEPHELLRYQLTAYIRVLMLGIVYVLARNLALWGRFWFVLGLILVVTSSWAIHVTFRLHQSRTSQVQQKTNGYTQKNLRPKNGGDRCYCWSTYPLDLLVEAPACPCTIARS